MRRLPVATVGAFFSIPWRQFPFPIAAGMLAHAALGADRVCRGKCRDWGIRSLHPGIIVTPVIDRLHLPFVALAFSASSR
jgi:hypothetical protein